MLVDAHTHIFPPQVVEDRERFLDGEPYFAMLYADPKSRMVTADGLLEAMDAEGVDISWAMGFPWVREENARLHNDYLLEAAAAAQGRLKPFCCVHPPAGWAVAEAKRCLAAGTSGLGEIAMYDGDLDLKALEPLCRMCAEADKPFLLHTNEPVGHQYPGKQPMTLGSLYALVKTHPHTKLVLAHMAAGLFFYTLMKKEVSQSLANVWLDTAAAPYLYRPRIYGLAVEMLGAERVLLGSDYPLLPVSRYLHEFASPESGLSAQDIEIIKGRAAMGLIG